MNIVLNVTETERWSVLTQCIDGELCLLNESDKVKENVTKVFKEVCPINTIEIMANQVCVQNIIVCYQQAEYYLTESIRQGKDIKDASAKWLSDINELLAIQKKNRRKIKLLNIDQALTDYKGLACFMNTVGIKVFEHKCEEKKQDLALMLAYVFVSKTTDLNKLNVLVNASSQAFKVEREDLIDVERLLKNNEIAESNFLLDYSAILADRYRLKNMIDQEVSKREKIFKDIELLRKENKNLMKNNNYLISANKGFQEEIDLLCVQEKQMKNEIKRLQSEKGKLSAFNNSQEIKSVYEKIKIYKNDFENKSYELSLALYELSIIKKSIVWRLTKIFRVFENYLLKSKKKELRFKKNAQLLLASGLFDVDWYLKEYPDVAESNINPVEHFLKFGAAENRLPSPVFNSVKYLELNPDVAKSGINPLLHYVKFGLNENRACPVANKADSTSRCIKDV